MQTDFFETLPELPKVEKEQADMAWLLYELKYEEKAKRYRLCKSRTVYTQFAPALDKITKPDVGNVSDFVQLLQNKLDEKLDGHPPDTETLRDITKAPSPYKIIISNTGEDANGTTKINFEVGA